LSQRLTLQEIIEDRIPRALLSEDALVLVGSRTDGMFQVLTYGPDDLPRDRVELHGFMAAIREAILGKGWVDLGVPGVEACMAWTPVTAPEFDCAAFDTFKWDAIKERLSAEELQNDDQNDDHYLKSLYLGSIVDIAPSGQCRAPWSGATRCPLCGGHGNFINVVHDAQYLDRARQERAAITAKYSDQNVSYHDWSLVDKARCQQLDLQVVGASETRTCLFCRGDGSRIRIEDADFMEYLESKAGEFGAFITGSDGDGCDVLIQMCVPKEEKPDEDDETGEPEADAEEEGATEAPEVTP